MSIGARSQSAKTYLETHYSSFPSATLEELIKHGLHALRDTLQQDKELTVENTSLGIVGLGSSSDERGGMSGEGSKVEAPSALGEQLGSGTKKEQERFNKFRIVEGEDLKRYLDTMDPKDSQEEDGAPVQTRPATEIAGGDAPPAATGEEMQTD